MAETIPDARLRRLCAHLHDCGQRAVYEAMRAIITGADPYKTLSEYERIDPELLAALGGARLPPPSFFVVEAREC